MKRLTVFRFLIGLALLCAGALTLYAQASFPEIFVVNSTGDGDDAFRGGGHFLRFFDVPTSGTVTLSGLALVNGGVLDDNGGGIQNYNAGTVNVTNCSLGAILALSDNTAVATDGGGIYNRAGGTINIINSELTATSADGGNGGCIYNSSTGTIHVTNSYLSDSYASANGVSGAGNGGAVYNGGIMTITNTTVYLFDADLTNGGGNPGGNG